MGYWNKLKANWYRRALDYSGFPDAALGVIGHLTTKAKTFLDAGCGCGTLALPLAKAGKTVTALDPSKAMLDILVHDARILGLQKKIKPILSEWREADIQRHDVIICSNVPELLKDPRAFITRANDLARKAVFLIINADPKADKFYYKELYPLLFNKEFTERGGYISTYTTLADMGIFANVRIIDYDFDQPFDSIDEAVLFWKEYLGLVTGEHDAKLLAYLSKKLIKRKKTLFARFHKKSAVIWWETTR